MARLAGPARVRDPGNPLKSLDAEVALRQALALQRREAALNSDLRAAEVDLAADPNDRNFQRLRDLRAQLSNFEGMDASVTEPSTMRTIRGR